MWDSKKEAELQELREQKERRIKLDDTIFTIIITSVFLFFGWLVWEGIFKLVDIIF